MKLALLGVAALAATALVTPVKAQEVITNPGRCAQFYPNANCQNLGPGNPYVDRYGTGWRRGYAYVGRPQWRYRHHRHYYYH